MTRVIGWPDLPFRESYDDDHKGRTCPYLSGLNVWFRGVATRQRGRGTPGRRRRRRLAGSPASGPRARASASCRWCARPRAASCRWHPAPHRSLPCPCPGDFLFPEKEKKKTQTRYFHFFPPPRVNDTNGHIYDQFLIFYFWLFIYTLLLKILRPFTGNTCYKNGKIGMKTEVGKIEVGENFVTGMIKQNIYAGH